MPPRVRLRCATSSLSSSCSQSTTPISNVSLNQNQIRTIRSILNPPPKPNAYNQHPRTPHAVSAAAALARREHTTPFRTGLLARKMGMCQTFDPDTGHEIPCTVLQVDRCQVIGKKTRQQNGYWAVQVGMGWKPHARVSKADLGDFSAKGVSVKQDIREFQVRGEEGILPVGVDLHPSWFKVGQLVDARGVTKGKGFAGGMKRHGFKGQGASHGQSLTHRTMGSAGGSQGSGSRVLPGKRMAGNMGNERHAVQHLKVMKVDDLNGLILVKGCVSGAKRSVIEVYDSKKRPEQKDKLQLPMIPLPPTYQTATIEPQSEVVA